MARSADEHRDRIGGHTARGVHRLKQRAVATAAVRIMVSVV